MQRKDHILTNHKIHNSIRTICVTHKITCKQKTIHWTNTSMKIFEIFACSSLMGFNSLQHTQKTSDHVRNVQGSAKVVFSKDDSIRNII